MKIGVNTRIYQNANTGIPYFIMNLYKTLQKIDKDNKYVFFQTAKNKTLGNTKVLKTLPTILGTVLFDLILVNILIMREKIDLYHGPSHILPLFKIKRVKYLLTIHDLSFLVFPNSNPKLFYLYYKYVVKRSIRNADIVITDSQNTKRDIIHFYHTSPKKIIVIYPGLGKNFFKKEKSTRTVKDKYFFSLSTHTRRKNIISVIEVYARNEMFKQFKYVIAGLIPSFQLNELKDLIASYKLEKSVLLVGYASEKKLINLYQNAEFFIYPSFYEGFGFPILEAMACGCPVIASNNSSIPEVTPSDRWLVNPHDKDDIESKMVKILKLNQEKRKQLIDKNQNFVKIFNWTESARKYQQAFQQLKQ